MKKRALARPVGPQDGHHLPLGHRQGDTAQSLDGAVGGGEILDDEQVLRHGATSVGEFPGLAEVRAVLQPDSQIGLDDRGILLHHLRPALGDQFSVVKHVDLFGDAHDELDVVLDE